MKYSVAPLLRLSALATIGLFSGGCFFPTSTLNQADKARTAEANITVGSLNRAQQATFLENDSFATTIDALNMPVPSETGSYTYELTADGEKSVITAVPKEAGLPSVVGAVYVVDAEAKMTQAIVCQSDGNAEVAPDTPVLAGDALTCAPGSKEPG